MAHTRSETFRPQAPRPDYCAPFADLGAAAWAGPPAVHPDLAAAAGLDAPDPLAAAYAARLARAGEDRRAPGVRMAAGGCA